MKILVLIGLLFSGFGIATTPVYAAEEPQTDLTEEEIEILVEELLADGYELVIGFWESFTAIVGITGIGSVIALAIWIMRKFGVFTKEMAFNDELLVKNAESTKELANAIEDQKKAIVALLTIANIDSKVKLQLLKEISEQKTAADFANFAQRLVTEPKPTINEAAESILTELTRKV